MTVVRSQSMDAARRGKRAPMNGALLADERCNANVASAKVPAPRGSRTSSVRPTSLVSVADVRIVCSCPSVKHRSHRLRALRPRRRVTPLQNVDRSVNAFASGTVTVIAYIPGAVDDGVQILGVTA